jgi:ATP-dependent RNA helicase MSS116, mitochondrial
LEKILAFLTNTKPTRQTLLFPATMPQALSYMATQVLKKDHVFIDTVGEEDVQTHLHVQQRFVECSWADQVYAVQALLAEHVQENPTDYKIIVFFTTARLTGFMAELFNSLQNMKNGSGNKILEIHSRKSQAARTKASDQFRAAKTAIMFSSDVSARGLDYPDVTFVLQVGLTERDQYIHRLGRSGRAGKVGGGALLVATDEAKWMKRTLSDLPLQFVDLPAVPDNAAARNALTTALQRIESNAELKGSAEQAYRAWLGFYNGHTKKVNWDKVTLVEQANQWSRDHGLSIIPSLEARTVGKMGLRGVRGLNVESGGGGGNNNHRNGNSRR